MVYHSLKSIMGSKNKMLTPAELVKIHLKDPSHVITDEELKKVKVGVDGEDKSELENKISQKKEELNIENKRDVPDPYDLLDM